MNGMMGVLIPFAIRLVVSYMIMRIVYSWILSMRIYFIKDKLKSVEATRIKHVPKVHRNDSSDMQSAVYEYYVDGKRYTAGFGFATERDIFPLKTTLHYRKNPKNAFFNNGIKTEDEEKKRMLIIAVAYAIFMTLFWKLIDG